MSGLSIIEGGVISTAFHWYVIYGLGSNNALDSARLPFMMLIFLLTPFNTRNCCSWIKYQAGVAFIKVFLTKKWNVIL